MPDTSRIDGLFAPVTTLKPVGTWRAGRLARLIGRDAESGPRIIDLLFHAPTHAIDRRTRTLIADAPHRTVATLSVHVDRHEPPRRPRAPYRVLASDESGEIALVFFRPRVKWLTGKLPVGARRIVSGRLEWYDGRPQMVHPDLILSPEEAARLPAVEPVYPLTEGLTNAALTQIMATALERIEPLPEWLDAAFRARRHWPAFDESLRRLHRPVEPMDALPGGLPRERLAYDELLASQLALAIIRSRAQRGRGIARRWDRARIERLRRSLPFRLTPSQERAIADVADDLSAPRRMLRLLQGDVGAGKTIVAAFAAAMVAGSGGQTAVMAPTDLLARQHFETLKGLLEPAGFTVALVSGRLPPHELSRARRGTASGAVDVAVGTHALFQTATAFRSLGLVVVDEQHRFGVHQRLALSEKGAGSDLLVMTATPIPRTLVLSQFGDMDASLLTGKPAGRSPVDTRAVPLRQIESVVARLGAALGRGEKAYWICPLVEESEASDLAAAVERHAALEEALDTQVGLLHGRMKAEEREEVMARFRDGELRVLVATTVVEVGVDVPDATIMVIEHAERFGLAQLHQLRGRVGRGARRSTCVLLYKGPLSDTAKARLAIMRETNDGFRIAEEDLKLRGEGELLGTRQSGAPGFRFASLELHGDLMLAARDDARLIVGRDPDLASERGRALRILLHLFERREAIRLLRAG